MGYISRSIGNFFESRVESDFPNLAPIDSLPGMGIRPDFAHDDFVLEAKVGNQLWGPRLKEYQVKGFPHQYDQPVIYVLGMHNFNHATKRLNQKTEWGRQRYLSKHMRFVESFILSQKVVESFWDHESKWNNIGTELYCMVRSHMLLQIMEDRTIVRKGASQKASQFYELPLESLVCNQPHDVGLSYKLGWILHDTEAPVVLEYLKNEMHISTKH